MSSHGSLSELLSKPLWALTIYPFYREVIIEVDYTQQQNLISEPLRNTETFGLKFSGKAYSKRENEQRALHFKLQFRCVFLIKRDAFLVLIHLANSAWSAS